MVTMNHQFAQTFSLVKEIKELGEKRCQAAQEKMKQLYDCILFQHMLIKHL
jgi:hypothetical protein